MYVPFPLSEKLLCYFSVYLAERKLTSQTIRTYLVAAHSMHITLGFPDPCYSSSLPLLQRIQVGIKRVQANRHSPPTRIQLPITPVMLDQLHTHWEETEHPDRLALWATSTLCFAGFFCLGELLPSSNNLLSPIQEV